MQGIVNLLQADKMGMTVKAPGGEDMTFAGNGFRRRTDDDVDTFLRIGIAGFPKRVDQPVFEADIGFENAGGINDQRIGDDLSTAPPHAQSETGPCHPVSPCRHRI